jgi:hypothetical protein
MIYALAGLAETATLCGDTRRATRLAGSVETLAITMGYVIEPAERRALDRAISGARAALSAEAFAMAWAEGQVMALEDAVPYALGENIR